jgi:hydrogenase/urease accessory protein HupE
VIRPRKRFAAVAGTLLLLPGLAAAHAPIEGLNSFYNGLLHPLVVLAHVFPLLALGLLFGQQGAMGSRFILVVYGAAIVLGLTAAALLPSSGSFADFMAGFLEKALLGSAAVLGLLIAIHPRLPPPLPVALGALTGLLVGMDSLMAGLAGKDKLAGLFGSGIVAYLLPLYPMALAESLDRRPRLKIAVRVLGSWIAASALLVLSLSLLPARP